MLRAACGCFVFVEARSRRHHPIYFFWGPSGAVPFPQNGLFSLVKCKDSHLYIIHKLELKFEQANGTGNHPLVAAVPCRRLQLCRPSAEIFMIVRM